MKIAVVSDSHGSLTAWEKAEGFFPGVDLVIHAGDLLYHGARNPLPEGYDTRRLLEKINGSQDNILAVKGNCDSLIDDWVLPYPLPEYSVVDDNGFRIVVYHGFQHETLEERFGFAERFGADLLIFGHIHRPLIEERGGIIVLNPGSIALPKQEPAVPTFAVIEGRKIAVCNLNTGEELLSL